ncbi:hypothetical protein FOZ63_031151, partial [Perkinsus olseni]
MSRRTSSLQFRSVASILCLCSRLSSTTAELTFLEPPNNATGECIVDAHGAGSATFYWPWGQGDIFVNPKSERDSSTFDQAPAIYIAGLRCGAVDVLKKEPETILPSRLRRFSSSTTVAAGQGASGWAWATASYGTVLLDAKYPTAQEVDRKVLRHVPTADNVLETYGVGRIPFNLCKLGVERLASSLL